MFYPLNMFKKKKKNIKAIELVDLIKNHPEVIRVEKQDKDGYHINAKDISNYNLSIAFYNFYKHGRFDTDKNIIYISCDNHYNAGGSFLQKSMDINFIEFFFFNMNSNEGSLHWEINSDNKKIKKGIYLHSYYSNRTLGDAIELLTGDINRIRILDRRGNENDR
ncbi:hypothetical protein ACFL1H_01740 [Nanoarchaeota archaeon]